MSHDADGKNDDKTGKIFKGNGWVGEKCLNTGKFTGALAKAEGNGRRLFESLEDMHKIFMGAVESGQTKGKPGPTKDDPRLGLIRLAREHAATANEALAMLHGLVHAGHVGSVLTADELAGAGGGPSGAGIPGPVIPPQLVVMVAQPVAPIPSSAAPAYVGKGKGRAIISAPPVQAGNSKEGVAGGSASAGISRSLSQAVAGPMNDLVKAMSPALPGQAGQARKRLVHHMPSLPIEAGQARKRLAHHMPSLPIEAGHGKKRAVAPIPDVPAGAGHGKQRARVFPTNDTDSDDSDKVVFVKVERDPDAHGGGK
jgi:hypothetical protein